MTENTSSTRTSKSTDGTLIGSDRIEGTKLFDPARQHIGTVKRLMIDKVSGRVAYVIASFGGFLGMRAKEYAVPWDMLTYDPSLGGYATEITKEQLEGAPSFYRASAGGVGTGRPPAAADPTGMDLDTDDYVWSDRNAERELHDYYAVAYYWEE
jgi:PRC-barrel domain